ncbi:hypothetical protein GT347_05870 [Xylophilus rhododendri]|uniref:Uncharacterized protein n=1 Tax=Xylophilus rhododendri TaxID=2697032 RepID=A0A857J1S7_9BURK|nr:hypothetical protein [Xylophilus rhododendri]QHI97557.1 hypothetical protein GT347_05870 [Xylophilus rhododendri]
MRLHALCVVTDGHGGFGWEVHARGLHPQMFELHSGSGVGSFCSYEAALEAGVLALVAVDAEAVQVGDALSPEILEH